ncbi:MAG: hypothetical protein SFW64_09240 [Alphaproteobacteria bacterium]|nr:hypothetical protein [Alphaproteobacteria bacterium]
MADSLLQEVDQALRADRAAALWKKHRAALIGVAVALIVGTAAHSVWQQQRLVRGSEILRALDDARQLLATGDAAGAAAAFQTVAADTRGQRRTLALVWQSRALLAARQPETAIATLKTAVDTGHGLWADIACLRLAGLDAAAAAPCLAAADPSPLAETRAQWAAATQWAQGETEAARAAITRRLADPRTSPQARDRLTRWQAVLDTPPAKARP